MPLSAIAAASGAARPFKRLFVWASLLTRLANTMVKSITAEARNEYTYVLSYVTPA